LESDQVTGSAAFSFFIVVGTVSIFGIAILIALVESRKDI
jgi:hypothetical protein